MAISFEGKVAIVTGAGGGLGRCHALELSRRGARVLINDLGSSVDGSGKSSQAAEAVAEEIKSAGGEALADAGSVTDFEQVAKMVESAHKAWGRVDILINNAGILRDKSFAKMTGEDFKGVIDVHLMGAFHCTSAVWPLMREQSYGRIVMTSSPSGLFGNFGQANYGAAKLALVGLMNTLKIEGAKHNVRTNSVAPVAATRMTEGLMPEEAMRAVPPELVTAGVLYLCTEDAPNGVILQTIGERYAVACMVENQGVRLGASASVDDVAENFKAIADLSGAKPRN